MKSIKLEKKIIGHINNCPLEQWLASKIDLNCPFKKEDEASFDSFLYYQANGFTNTLLISEIPDNCFYDIIETHFEWELPKAFSTKGFIQHVVFEVANQIAMWNIDSIKYNWLLDTLNSDPELNEQACEYVKRNDLSLLNWLMEDCAQDDDLSSPKKLAERIKQEFEEDKNNVA